MTGRSLAKPLYIAVGTLAVLMISVFIWLMLAHDPDAGQPKVVIDIERSDRLTTGSIQAPGPVAGLPTAPDTRSLPDRISPALPPAPAPSLVEAGRYGPLPRVSQGEKPLFAYARPLSREQVNSPLPKIALVIAGIGGDPHVPMVVLDRLPADITLAVPSSARDAQGWIDRAREKGHEVLLELPMEPAAFSEAGLSRRPILADAAEHDIVDDMHWHLSRASGYFAAANPSRSRYRSNAEALRTIFRELGQRGLGFIEITPGTAAARQVATSMGLDYAGVDLVVDANPTGTRIEAALDRLVDVAQRNGFAMASATATPTTIERLSAWLDKVNGREAVVVPASAALLMPRNGWK
ncbi:divergent polysaccharide deacetylase family protein [Rhodoligotrophos defluvii]|uniref:divergent polysaccharide deacetylase family protein n=1 Tax=Rhodoligotrophos defluvii TaxID=2561934 RepID=UPI0014854DAB|nr:divergent polysaccharide deacetylase family protein [Rhodoligotrophos defluvii]